MIALEDQTFDGKSDREVFKIANAKYVVARKAKAEGKWGKCEAYLLQIAKMEIGESLHRRDIVAQTYEDLAILYNDMLTRGISKDTLNKKVITCAENAVALNPSRYYSYFLLGRSCMAEDSSDIGMNHGLHAFRLGAGEILKESGDIEFKPITPPQIEADGLMADPYSLYGIFKCRYALAMYYLHDIDKTQASRGKARKYLNSALEAGKGRLEREMSYVTEDLRDIRKFLSKL